MKKPLRGFSFIEILVVLGVMVFLLAAGVFRVRAPVSGASTQGLALTLASQLRSARARAISQHTYVGVAFPSAGGTRPHCQSFYFLEGDLAPKVSQVINLGKDLPEAVICSGVFPTTAAPTVAPPLGQAPQSGPAFKINAWLTGAGGYQAKDSVVGFAPDGTVVTNDMAWHGSQLQIVACSAFETSGISSVPGTPVAGANSANNFRITGMANAQTVCVSQTGQVWVVSGLAQSDGTLNSTPAGFALSPALPPTVGAVASTGPTIVSAQTLPQNGITVGSNSTMGACGAVVSSSGRMSIIVRAIDPDPGARLCCNLTVSGGQLSVGQGQPVRMTWDPTDTNATAYPNGCWKASLSWSPPGAPDDPAYNPPAGQIFQLSGRVTDDYGNSAPIGGAAGVISFAAINLGHIVFAANGPGGWIKLYRWNPATNQATLFPVPQNTGGHYVSPSASPDGSKIVYCSTYATHVCNADGSDNVQWLPYSVQQCPFMDGALTWSADGTRICYFDMWSSTNPAFWGSNSAIVIKPVTGNGPLRVIRDGIPTQTRSFAGQVTPFYTEGFVAWNPVLANSVLAYIDAQGHVAVCDPADAQAMTPAQFTAGSGGWGYPFFIPTSQAAYVPPSKKRLTTTAGYYYGLSWARDGSTLYWRNKSATPQIYSANVVNNGGGSITVGAPTVVSGADNVTAQLTVCPFANVGASSAASGAVDFYSLAPSQMTLNYSVAVSSPVAAWGWTWTK